MMTSRSKCDTPFCKNKRAPKSHKCYKCVSRKFRAANPIKAAFYALRDNAKRRGKHFALTFDQFLDFAGRTRYMELKGRSAGSFTIDRIRNEEGYHIKNIRCITLSENARKADKSMREAYARGWIT